MATVGTGSRAAMQRGRDDAIETINATDDASANLSNVSIFTNLIKKAEDGAQSAL